jgi:tetratricopeptide (TPR) repeat protein
VATWPDGTVAACYEFMHALYQQVAYQRVGAERRVQLHQRVGARLEAAYGPRTEEIAAELAEHFVRGRDARRAARYLRQAGVKATARSAHREAVAYFERALEALTDLPESGDAREQAIDLHFDLRNALLPLGDFGRMLDHLRRAESIAKALDDRRRLGWVSAYLTHYCFVSGDYDGAIEAGQCASAIARDLGELSLDVVANYYLGETYRALSDYPRAIAFLRKSIEPLHGELVYERFGLAGLPAVLARVYLAACLAEVGEFSEGIVVTAEAMRIAQDTAQPYNLIIASTGIGRVCFRQGDFRRVMGVLEAGLQHCEAYNVPRWFPEIASRLGATYALCGRTSEALSLLERAVERSSAMNLIFGHALRVAWLSESYLLAGRWGALHNKSV